MPKDILTRMKEAEQNSRSKLYMLMECKDEIQTAIQGGRTLKAIWRLLKHEGKITYSYEGFRGAVAKHIAHRAKQQITPKEKPQPVVEVVRPPPPPALATANPDPGWAVAKKLATSIEPEQPKPVREKESKEVAEARRQRSIEAYRAQKGKPLRFKSNYTLQMEAEEKTEKERTTNNGENSSDSGE